MKVLARAKVNLFLRVIGIKPDGFHELDSVFHSLDLADELDVRSTENASIVVEGIDFDDDTVTRAARALRDATGTSFGASIVVTKDIPIGAGLAGGSADAAAALVALDRSWSTDLGADGLRRVGETVGSDVPFCLVGGPARVGGRGELVTPLAAPVPLWLVLGISNRGLETPAVYRRFDEMAGGGAEGSEGMVAALTSGDVPAIAAALHNDLEVAAFDLRPELVDLKLAMTGAGALGACMSGSGPTMFGICSDESHARRVADELTSAFDRVVVAHTEPTGVVILEA